jgi:hypothetical protein
MPRTLTTGRTGTIPAFYLVLFLGLVISRPQAGNIRSLRGGQINCPHAAPLTHVSGAVTSWPGSSPHPHPWGAQHRCRGDPRDIVPEGNRGEAPLAEHIVPREALPLGSALWGYYPRSLVPRNLGDWGHCPSRSIAQHPVGTPPGELWGVVVAYPLFPGICTKMDTFYIQPQNALPLDPYRLCRL